MKYTRFEELPVWQAAMTLAEQVFQLTMEPCLQGQGDLRSQLQRATLSISNNVAEGFERGTTQELISFLYIARGSAGEVRSMLCLLERLERFAHLRSEISDLKSDAESIARQLRAWADSLQNADIKGQRHLTDKVRQQEQRRRQAAAFQEELRRIQHQARSDTP
jgi:four helix bundle protein